MRTERIALFERAFSGRYLLAASHALSDTGCIVSSTYCYASRTAAPERHDADDLMEKMKARSDSAVSAAFAEQSGQTACQAGEGEVCGGYQHSFSSRYAAD